MPLSITRRKDRGSVLTITGRIRYPDGRTQRIRQSAQSNDLALAREEASALETRLLREAIHGRPRGSELFARAVNSYLDADERAPGDIDRLKRIVAALGPNMTCADINQQTVVDLKRRLHKRAPAPGTVNRGIIVPIRAVLRYAHTLGWCDVPYFTVPKKTRGRTNYLLPGEMLRLVVAASPHIKPLLTFLVCTGARMAEAIELDWHEVDLLGRRVILLDTKNGLDRIITNLPPAAVTALEALPHRDGRVFKWQTVTPKRAGKAAPRVVDYVDRERKAGGHIRTAWKGALRRAGLSPKLTPHDLRHTWASWHYAVHKDPMRLKRDGGWSSLDMVERYAHLLPEGHEAEIRAFYNGAGHQPVTETAEVAVNI